MSYEKLPEIKSGQISESVFCTTPIHIPFIQFLTSEATADVR